VEVSHASLETGFSAAPYPPLPAAGGIISITNIINSATLLSFIRVCFARFPSFHSESRAFRTVLESGILAWRPIAVQFADSYPVRQLLSRGSTGLDNTSESHPL
jgi:hypothetical protein